MSSKWGIGIAIAVAAGAYLVYSALPADRDETGAIVSAGAVDAFQMRVGDCFDDASSFDDDEVDSVAGVPCSKPHDNEVYAIYDIAAPSFPGDEISDMAHEGCLERFESFVGKDYDSSSLDIQTLYPSSETWHGRNDREVICAVYDVELSKLTGSVKGTRL